MRLRSFVFGVVLVAVIALPALVAGQEAQRVETGASATATPRMSDGHPDLNGYWYRRAAPVPPVQRIGKTVILDRGAPRPANAQPTGNDPALLPGTPKYRPEFLAKVKELDENQVKVDPAFTCGPPGVPRIGPPQRIFHRPGEVVILYDDLNGNFFRIIPTDGRPHRMARPAIFGPGTLPISPSAHGESVGRWEGDTLVIDVRNLSGDTWLGDGGLIHTENVRVTERLRRVGDTLTWEAIVDDPAVLAEPWKLNPRVLTLRSNDEIEEAAFCADRVQPILQNLEHHRNTR